MPIITPVDRPSSTSTASQTSTAEAARARALAILSGGQAQAEQPPVQNQNAISPEEASVVLQSEKVQENNTKSEPESKAATEDKEEPLSSQFAVLARKEKALRVKAQQQEAAIKAREEALAAREAKLAAKDTEYQSDYIPKSKLLEDTLGVLAEAGIDYEQLTQLALNPPPKQDPATKAYIAKLEARLADIDGKLEQQQQSVKDSQTKSYQQAIAQIEKDATKLVQSSEEYEAIRTTGSVKDVVKLIEKTFSEDGELMTVEEACKEIEDYLIEESSKLAQLKKVQARLNANKAPKDPQPPTDPSPKQPQMKTLTNAVGVTRQLSARERAIMAARGELK